MKKLVKGVSHFFVLMFAVSIGLLSCGGGGGGGDESAQMGETAFFITDDPAEDFDTVELTITKVQLKNTGTEASCDLFVAGTPEDALSEDLTDLRDVLLLVNLTECEATSFNRFRIEFDKNVTVIDNGVSDTCELTSFKEQGSSNVPKVVQCDEDDPNSCFIEINGAVNVLANQLNEIGLDFELRESEIENFDDTNAPCTVTFKTSPINASDKEGTEEISGVISNLDPINKTFTMTEDNATFLVDYFSIIDIDDLLQLALNNNLEVEVKCSELNLETEPIQCTASEIELEVEGTVQNFDPINNTFELNLGASIITVQITLDTEVEGTIANGEEVEVELIGLDGINFIAAGVKVESE